MKVTKYFMRVNGESIEDMLREFGSFEGGFDTPEEVWGDFEPERDDYEVYEVIKMTAETVKDVGR